MALTETVPNYDAPPSADVPDQPGEERVLWMMLAVLDALSDVPHAAPDARDMAASSRLWLRRWSVTPPPLGPRSPRTPSTA